ncbi:MAG TPA: DUF883 domain-containing protein [Burkholderiales bacterium]|nr:DUF883 domain-containing protein [Burkholderiales bacterium]
MQENEVTPDKLAADLRLVISDAEALLRAAVGETAEAGRAKLHEGLEAAKLKLGPLAEEAAEHARDSVRAADGYVREHPWNAVGIAVLAGVALGLLISRK